MKIKEKRLARKLRFEGRSLRAIASKVKCSKGTVSRWISDIKLTDAQIKQLKSNQDKGRAKAAMHPNSSRQKWERIRNAARATAKAEIPINYSKRMGNSKLRPFSDGWKHLRFMLLYSPLFLFFTPGVLLFFLGTTLMTWFYFYSPKLFGVNFFYHPMFLFSLMIIVGYQLVIFSGFAKIYSISHLDEKNPKLENLFKYITIERAILTAVLPILAGIAIFIFVMAKWINSGFGALSEIKNLITGLTLVVIGIQTVFSSFMLSILSIKEK